MDQECPNPTTQEVDDFIRRQEEVEHLRNKMFVPSKEDYQSWSGNARTPWKVWKEMSEEE